MNRARLCAQLGLHEGVRLTVYDDATGRPLLPGMTLVGHATIGVGRELCHHGLTTDEVAALLEDDVLALERQLARGLLWFYAIDEVRQRAVADVAFSTGLRGFLRFVNVNAAIARRDFDGAAAALRDSDWFRARPVRGPRVAQMLQTGVDPL